MAEGACLVKNETGPLLLPRSGPASFVGSVGGLGLNLLGWGEACASGDNADLEVESLILGQTAWLNQHFRSLALQANLNELGLIGNMLAEVGAKTALTFVDLNRDVPPCNVYVVSETGDHLCDHIHSVGDRNLFVNSMLG